MFECFECGKRAHHAHHVVPRSRGGKRTIPLCNKCHANAHYRTRAPHPDEIKEGMKRAKEKGIHVGRPREYPHVEILYHFRAGKTVNELAEMYG